MRELLLRRADQILVVPERSFHQGRQECCRTREVLLNGGHNSRRTSHWRIAIVGHAQPLQCIGARLLVLANPLASTHEAIRLASLDALQVVAADLPHCRNGYSNLHATEKCHALRALGLRALELRRPEASHCCVDVSLARHKDANIRVHPSIHSTVLPHWDAWDTSTRHQE